MNSYELYAMYQAKQFAPRPQPKPVQYAATSYSTTSAQPVAKADPYLTPNPLLSSSMNNAIIANNLKTRAAAQAQSDAIVAKGQAASAARGYPSMYGAMPTKAAADAADRAYNPLSGGINRTEADIRSLASSYGVDVGPISSHMNLQFTREDVDWIKHGITMKTFSAIPEETRKKMAIAGESVWRSQIGVGMNMYLNGMKYSPELNEYAPGDTVDPNVKYLTNAENPRSLAAGREYLPGGKYYNMKRGW